MGEVDLRDAELRLDELTTRVLPALRAEKRLDPAGLDALCDLVASLGAGSEHDLFPMRLTGKLWFVFTAMLTEAEYAPDPDAILNGAWRYQEELRRLFGPRLG